MQGLSTLQTNKTPFSLNLSWQPFEPTAFVTRTAQPTDAKSEAPPKVHQHSPLSCLFEMQHSAKRWLKAAQQGYSNARTANGENRRISH